ncbi:unnamed protein product [Prunus armeniaca]
MSMEIELKVKEEIERLVKAGFIRPAIYADWLANIVPVLKRKTRAIRICVDYRNLNEASPKDEYRHIGAFEYTVMPFGLRIARATYQRAMNSVFHDMIEVSIGSLLVQDNKEGKEQAVYYLSRTLTEVERTYSAIERLCLALYFTAVKLRHYMLPFTIYIIAKTDLIKYMLTRPMLRRRIGKWTLALTEFAFRYVPQKAVKGQAVVDFLADHPGEEIENMDSLDIKNADLLTRAHTCLNNPIYSVHLTPWKLYFDGSKTDVASGAGIVLEDPLGIVHCYSFQLDFQCTNNRAEYEALIIGLEMLVELGIQSVEMLGDSMLVLKQIAGEYKCLNPSLAVYLVAAINLLTKFREATWEHIPREENCAANEMAQIATGVQMPEDCVQRIIKV